MIYNSTLVSKMTKPLTLEENNILYQQILAGDKQAIEDMIVGNMALVISKTNDFIGSRPWSRYLNDDLISAGFIGLIEAVNKLPASLNNTVTSYLIVSIERHFGTLLEHEMTIRVPYESERLARKKGKPIKKNVVQSVEELVELKPNDHSEVNLHPIRDTIVVNEANDLDMCDLIDKCCDTDTEREFVRLRLAGNTFAEITELSGTPLTSLYRLSCKLHNKVLQKLQD